MRRRAGTSKRGLHRRGAVTAAYATWPQWLRRERRRGGRAAPRRGVPEPPRVSDAALLQPAAAGLPAERQPQAYPSKQHEPSSPIGELIQSSAWLVSTGSISSQVLRSTAINMMSEELLPVFVPIIVYWIGAAIYQLTLSPKEQYRLFIKEEEETQNLASRRQVLAGVLVNQSGGVATASAAATSPLLLRTVGQMVVAMLIMDCSEYFWHRWMHENKFLYKHVHAMHHHIIVPYTYGSQYIHPVDAVVGEIFGTMVAVFVSGMSPRTTAVFLSLLTLKGLDDHCGMWFPNHPIHRWMANNAAFHALHHQHVGIKYNYSVHFLATWDLLLGTYLPFSVEPRKEGGYLLQTAKEE